MLFDDDLVLIKRLLDSKFTKLAAKVLPLQIYFFFQAFKTGSWKYIFLSAATLALMVFNGGTHILPMSIAALGMFSLSAAIGRRDWRPLAFA